MKTYNATPETTRREWLVIDATDKVLGRIASEAARRLRGKHKAEFTPHVDTGDYIVIVNAEKVVLTGRKEQDKLYHHHTGYPGGIKQISAAKLREKNACAMVEKAVKGMMPRNSLGRAMLRKLKVYAGAEHRHTAQQPREIQL